MAKSILISFLILLCTVTLQAQPGAASTPDRIQKVVVNFFDALASLDAQKAKSFCADDISLLESGQVWNMDSLALRINSRKARTTDFKRVNKLDFIETKISGDAAWTSYFNTAVISANNKTVTVKWLESIVLKMVGNEWKIALLHSTELEKTQ